MQTDNHADKKSYTDTETRWQLQTRNHKTRQQLSWCTITPIHNYTAQLDNNINKQMLTICHLSCIFLSKINDGISDYTYLTTKSLAVYSNCKYSKQIMHPRLWSWTEYWRYIIFTTTTTTPTVFLLASKHKGLTNAKLESHYSGPRDDSAAQENVN